MSRLAIVAAAVLLAVVAIVAVRAAAPDGGAGAERLAGELRCPDCQGLSVAESHTAAAEAIRAEIERQLAAGRTPDEVRDHFVARYGEWILLAPRDPLAWLAPLAALAAGLLALAAWLAGRRRRAVRSGGAGPGSSSPAPPSAEERARVRDELEALDA